MAYAEIKDQVEYSAARRTCAAVVQRALLDAKNGHVDSIVWLASRMAENWIDCLDMDQAALLLKSGWIDWAEVALEGTLSKNQRQVLIDTLDYLEEMN